MQSLKGQQREWGTMGRPEGPLDRDGSPRREFAFWLRDLRRRSGLTYEQLAGRAHYATSTVQAAADGRRLPTLRVTLSFVAACGGDQPAWREYWTRISRMLDPSAPDGVGRSVSPPWLTTLPAPAVPAPAAPADPPGRPGLSEDWFVESFSALVRVDTEPVEVIERKTIVASADDVTEIAASLNVPRHPNALDQPVGLESELLYGGSLELREQRYDSYFTNVIMLPRPLRRGERHEYAMRLRIPPGQRMASHFLHVPHRRSDHFDLRVRFDPQRLPSTIWLLRDAPTAMIYQGEPATQTAAPDRFGEVHTSFRDMRLGLGYGLRWRDRD
jgi:Helix-turn-helix domain